MSGETEKDISSWTVDSLHSHIQQRLQDMRELMDERYESAQRAIDVAFAAQQAAMSTALTAAEHAVSAALVSAEKAVAKAESATEKRIAGLNELRQVVTDIGTLQMPRVEAEQRIGAVTEMVSELKDRISRIESAKVGGKETLSGIYALAGFLVSLLVLGGILAAAGVFSGS